MTATTSNDDIFSDGYLDQFYKTHVATSRRTSIDEDIAAIEAEINKYTLLCVINMICT